MTERGDEYRLVKKIPLVLRGIFITQSLLKIIHKLFLDRFLELWFEMCFLQQFDVDDILYGTLVLGQVLHRLSTVDNIPVLPVHHKLGTPEFLLFLQFQDNIPVLNLCNARKVDNLYMVPVVNILHECNRLKTALSTLINL